MPFPENDEQDSEHENEAAGNGNSRMDGESIRRLLGDVRMLTMYAVETGQLPEQVSVQLIFQALNDWESNKEITPKQFAEIVSFYQILERHFPRITAHSLAATEPKIPGKIRTSPAGRYLTMLWKWTAVVVLLILTFNTIQYIHDLNRGDPGDEWEHAFQIFNIVFQATKYFEPFLYGALGSFAFLLRATEKHLPTREFDPIRAPEHVNRLVLGTLSGGSIILFIGQVPAENADGGYFEIGVATLGFLAGYSIDFLFETLDRIIRAILPKVGLETIPTKAREKRDQELIRRYKKMLDQSTDDDQKKVLREIIDDLDTR